MNHIKNMGCSTSLVFNKSGIDYNIMKDFGKVKLETIDIEYHALKLSTIPTDNIKQLKYRVLYTWLLNSSDESAQDLLSKESENCHRLGPLPWKIITANILRGVKQGIFHAQNMIHTLSLEKFANNINLLVKSLKLNCKLLASYGEIESSPG